MSWLPWRDMLAVLLDVARVIVWIFIVLGLITIGQAITHIWAR